MKLTELSDLFNKKIGIEQFKLRIYSEVTKYKKGVKKKGGSGSIYLEEDINDFEIKKEDLIFLCSLFLEKKIDQWELNYIAEAIVFASYEKLFGSEMQNALDSLTDPEYEMLVNDNFVKKIMEDLVVQ